MNGPCLSRDEFAYAAAAADELVLRERRATHRVDRGGLIEFVRDFWDVLEPNIPLVEGWCLDAMCDHLEAVAFGEIKRLLINVSPGSMKSLLTNVFFPAWIWGALEAPDHRFLAFSYSAHLTERDNERFRDVLQSVKYLRMYGDGFRLTKDGARKIQNDKTGWKFASSVGGVGTGERGNGIIIDDAHNVKDAESEKVRDSTVTWFREAIQNRLNDFETGWIIAIGQRVNEGDVSGCIIENYPDYVHLCIPMEYETGRHCKTVIGWTDPRSKDGELAWPERFSLESLAPFRTLPYLWAGQYQQRPEPRGGGILKRDYWGVWDAYAMAKNDVKIGSFPPFDYVMASLDGAFTEKEENDPSALTVWGLWFELTDEMRLYSDSALGNPKFMLVDAWRKWLELTSKPVGPMRPDETGKEYEDRQRKSWGLVENVLFTCRKHKIDKLLIENKATGIPVANEIRKLIRGEFQVQLYEPRGDKVARAHAVQSLFTDGMVWRPETEWAQMVEDECAVFPRGRFKDLTDTTTAALAHFRRMGYAARSDEARDSIEEKLFPSRPKKKRLYEA